MCGIAGWVDYERTAEQLASVTQTMTATMACRGPDDEGLWLDNHCALGHQRLAVIDIDGGHQPMTVQAGGKSIAVTFSGEIYNFRELTQELTAQGHTFTSRSDTEVILRAYLQWGAAFAEKLNGMFGLAIWDSRTEELILARDRLGVKPLFYYPTASGVLFGSEPKAILAHPEVPCRVDADGMREILDLIQTPGLAIFAGMDEVRPGFLVRVKKSGMTHHQYWALEATEHRDDLDTTISTVRELLEDTVSLQLVSDVPLCSLLSGGLDSSAITAIASQTLAAGGHGPVRSFAVDFSGLDEQFEPDAVRGQSDTPFARELANHVGAEHAEVILDCGELSSPLVREKVLRALDVPPAFWGDMWPSLYLLFRAIGKHSTVALSGESADELFGGYRWFHNPAVLKADTFPWSTPGSLRYFGGTGLFDRDFLTSLDIPTYRSDQYRKAINEVPVLVGEEPLERRMREITYLNLTRFVQALLDRKDRMSMATGLEVRVPFCDHRLVEYVFNVPWAMKSFDGREKSLLRAATADLLPDSISKRKKTPYPAIQDPGYENRLRGELGELVKEGTAPVLQLLDLDRVHRRLATPVASVSQPYDRGSIELTLWLNQWLTSYQVTLDL